LFVVVAIRVHLVVNCPAVSQIACDVDVIEV
jgi:hypothetical protein